MRHKLTAALFFLCATAPAQNPKTAVFPGAAATDNDLLVQTNNAHTTLAAAINTSVTTVTLTNATLFPPPVAITIDNEILKCLTRAGAAYTCSRAFDGSIAASHAQFAPVHGYAIAAHSNQTNAEVKAIETWAAGAYRLFNVRTYGAKGDERTVSDAAMTAGSADVTSPTGAFTPADSGKTVTVFAGPRGLYSAGSGGMSYLSGGSVTGAAGKTCSVGGFNGGGSGATGIVVLTGTNVIAGPAVIYINTTGTGYSSGATAATLGNGTAVCSGSIVVQTDNFYVQPITATAAYVNASTLHLTVSAVTSVTGAVLNIGTDDSAAVLAAMAAASAAGGGTVYSPAGTYLILSQLAVPNDGAVLPRQAPLKLLGDGSMWDGSWTCRDGASIPSCLPNAAASVWDLRYPGAVAKIDTRGRGSLTFEDISMEDRGYDQTAFVQTTNTTLFTNRVSWVGSGPGVMASQQDAIILGGGNTPNTWGGLATSAFQGYGSVLDRNYFSKITRGFYGKVWVNDVVFSNNTWSNTCGGITAFELDGTGDESQSNPWTNNLFESSGYLYDVTFRNSFLNPGFGNTAWDGIGIFIAGIRLVGTAGRSGGNSCLGCSMSGAGFRDEAGGNEWMYSNGIVTSGNPALSGLIFSNIISQAAVTAATNVIVGSGSQLISTGGSKLYSDVNGSWTIWNSSQNGFNFLKFGGLGTPFPALKRVGNALAIRTAADTVPVFSALDPCNSAAEGAVIPVTDSTTGIWGASITGGGSTHVLAYCNGSAWTVR